MRQAEFIGVLAETGSVRAAAEFVGMARETAYRLRRKPGAEDFARAWDVAVAMSGVRPSSARAVAGEPRTHVPPKVSPDDLWRRIVDGRWRPVLRRGKYVGSVHKADNSALLGHLALRCATVVSFAADFGGEHGCTVQELHAGAGTGEVGGVRTERLAVG